MLEVGPLLIGSKQPVEEIHPTPPGFLIIVNIISEYNIVDRTRNRKGRAGGNGKVTANFIKARYCFCRCGLAG